MISLRGISKTYELPGRPVGHGAQDVDLTIDRGEFMVITGRSGSARRRC